MGPTRTPVHRPPDRTLTGSATPTGGVELNAVFDLARRFDDGMRRSDMEWLAGWSSQLEALVDLLQWAHPRQASMLTEAMESMMAAPVIDEADIRDRLMFLRWGLSITLRELSKGRAA